MFFVVQAVLVLTLEATLTLAEIYIFFYQAFLSSTFANHRTAGERGGDFFNSSLPLPPASQILRHQSADYCRELTSANREQPDLNREPLISERKSLTTKLRAPVVLCLSPHETNIACKYRLHRKPIMKYKQTFSLVSDIHVVKACFLNVKLKLLMNNF